MIKPDKINEDGLPVLNWEHNEDGLPVIKKKASPVGGNVTGTLNGGGLRSDIDPSKYETKLSPQEETQFKSWFENAYKKGHIAKGDYDFYRQKGYGLNYDFRAAFKEKQKAGISKVDNQWHWSDIGKKPNHPTFSNESKYNNVDGYVGGTWDGEKFNPPLNGGGLKSGEREQILEYMQGLKTPQQGVIREPLVATKPKTKGIPVSMRVNEKSVEKAHNKLNEIMLSDDDRWKDPIKALQKEVSNTDIASDDFNTLNIASEIARESLAPDGYEAKKVLETTKFGGDKGDNQTANLLKDKAARYEKSVAPLKEIIVPEDLSNASDDYLQYNYSGQIDNAAIKWYADKNNDFKRQLQSSKIDLSDPDLANRIPNAKKGQIVSEFFNDSDINTFIEKENPNLQPVIESAQRNLLKNNKDYAINQVANEVSREIQNQGFNKIDPVFNFNTSASQEFANLTAEQLYRDNPEKLAIYNEVIRDKQEDFLDKPSFFEGFASGAKDILSGIKSTVTLPFTPKSENIKEQWVKEASHVSANPNGFVGFVRDAGHATGFVAGLVAGGQVGVGLGLTPVTAQRILVAGSFYGEQWKQAQMKYKSPVKVFLSAGLNTAGFVYMSNIFPSAKISQILNESKPEISQVISKLTSGEIKREAAKQEMMGVMAKGIEFGKKALNQNVKISSEMAALTGMNQALDKVLGLDEQTFEKYHPEGEVLDTFEAMFMSNAIIAPLAAYGSIKANKDIVKNNLYKAASNPNKYKRIAETNGVDKLEEIKANVDFVAKAKKELSENGIPEDQQKTYLLHAANERILKERIQNTTEPSIKKMYEDQAKRSAGIKEGILKGLTEEQVQERQAIKDVKELYNEDLLTRPQRELLESKETPDSEGKFDEKKVKKFLEFVAQQSNNIKEGGEFDPSFDVRKSTKFSSQLVDLANELFPEYKKTAEEYDAINKIEEPIELDPTLPEGYKAPEEQIIEAEVNIPKIETPTNEQKTEVADIPDTPKNQSADIGTSEKIGEATSEGTGGKEPPKETVIETEAGEIGGITQAANEVRRKDTGLSEFERNPQSFEQWNREAEKLLKEGYDVEALMKRLQKGDDATPVENAIRKIYYATVDAEVAKNPTDALLSLQKRNATIGDEVNRRAGQNLVSLKGENSPLDSISDFYVAKMEAAGVDKLTEKQKQETKEAFDNVQKADANATAAMEAYLEEISKLKAENELLKQKKESRKSKQKDVAEERKQIVGDILLKLSKARGESASFLGAAELASIAPDVLRLVKNIAVDASLKLAEIVDRVHDLLKDGIPDLEKKNIHDIIAGEFNKKRPTRSELAIKMRDLKDEAYYANKLQRLLSGTEPTSEKKKVKRNQEITDLRQKIETFKKTERDAAKEPKEEIPDEVKKLQAIVKRNEKQESDIIEKIRKGDFETNKEVPFLENPEMQKKFPQQYKAALDAIVKRDDARHEFDLALLKDQMAKRSVIKKGIDLTGDVIGTTKAVVTGIDASGIAIQNLVAMVTHPRSAAKALPGSVADLLSGKTQERWLAGVHNSKVFQLSQKAGLDITEPKSLKASEREELFTHNLLDRRIKYKGKTYVISKYTTKPFERLFTGLGNRMRWNLWVRGVEKLQEDGFTFEKHPEEFKSLAKVLNTETGRGTLHPQIEKAFNLVSAGIWSPRLMASRMNILGLGDIGNLIAGGKKGYYGGLTPRMRAYALKDLGKFIIFGTSLMGLAGLTFADDVDFDPNSSTFGTFSVNGKRYNIWGGFTQYVRFVAKLIMGGEKSDGVFRASSPLKTTGRFLWSKTTPAVNLGIGLLNKDKEGVSRDYMGQPITPLGAAASVAVPLSIRGIIKGVEKEGLGSILWTGVPSFIGLNVSYESDFNKDTSNKEGKKESGKKEGKKQSGKKQD